jgi:glutaredoxin
MSSVISKENSESKEQSQLIFNKKDNLYYQPDDKKHLFPFCPHCYEALDLKIHLTKRFVCPHCRTDFHLLSVHGVPII